MVRLREASGEGSSRAADPSVWEGLRVEVLPASCVLRKTPASLETFSALSGAADDVGRPDRGPEGQQLVAYAAARIQSELHRRFCIQGILR